MATVQDEDVLGRTIVGFSRDGMFPEEDEVSAMHVQSSALPAALNALASAKVDLEVRSSACNTLAFTSSYVLEILNAHDDFRMRYGK
jgi:hypothetical protein